MKKITISLFFILILYSLYAQNNNDKIRMIFSPVVRNNGSIISLGNGSGGKTIFKIQNIILTCDSAQSDLSSRQYSFWGVEILDSSKKLLVQSQEAFIKFNGDSIIFSSPIKYISKGSFLPLAGAKLDTQSLFICFREFENPECLNLKN